jgi:hypothetical protein
VEFQIVRLSEIWLNYTCLYHDLFSDPSITFRYDSVNSTGCIAAVRTAVSCAVGTFKNRYDIELYDKWPGWKLPLKVAAVNSLVKIIPPPPVPNRTLFLNIFVYSRKILILKKHSVV